MATIINILAVITLVIIPFCSTEYHYIIPKDNSSLCNGLLSHMTNSCITLWQYAIHSESKDYQKDNITLLFAPGNHILEKGGITIIGAYNITLIGESVAGVNPVITCKQISCFLVKNISNIQVHNLTFSECTSKIQSGGALYIVNASMVSIVQCTFIDNLITQRGAAIRILFAINVHILRCQFINNSAICHPARPTTALFCLTGCNGSSGALSIVCVAFAVIEQSTFRHNSASCSGGALGVDCSSLKIINTYFVENFALADVLIGLGGAIAATESDLEVTGNFLIKNEAYRGGSISTLLSTLAISNSSFINNKARDFGGAAFTYNTNTNITSSLFTFNSAQSGLGGGAIYVRTTTKYFTTISNAVFANNIVASPRIGAAITLRLNEHPACVLQSCSASFGTINDSKSVAFISESNFSLQFGTAVEVTRGILFVTHCVFHQTTGSIGGGLFSVFNILYISKSNFTANSADLGGGAVHISGGYLESFNNIYINNQGTGTGGAVNAYNTTVILKEDLYLMNRAGRNGAAIFTNQSRVYSIKCNFSYNRAIGYIGGALHISEGTYNSTESQYRANYAAHSGGALFMINCLANISGDIFFNNTADFQEGAAIFLSDGGFYLTNTTFKGNQAIERNTRYVIQLSNTQSLIDRVTFAQNSGSFSVFYSNINFTGAITLWNNTAITGGSLSLIQSTVLFLPLSKVIISGNTGRFGGGLFLSETNVRIEAHTFEISENLATESGGGLYGYQSQFNVYTNGSVRIIRNKADKIGGGFSAVSTNIKIFNGVVHMRSNQAPKGGAAFLSEGSKIYVQKLFHEQLDIPAAVKLLFSNNIADLGGAIFVSDKSNAGTLCDQSTETSVRSLTSGECFIQTIRLYYTSDTPSGLFNYINIVFHSNIGRISGSDIFGGMLDRCQINAFAEIYRNFEFFQYVYDFKGIDYVKAIAQFDVEIDYNRLRKPYNPRVLANSITRENLIGLISSNALQLCFCSDTVHYDCSYQHPRIRVRRGERFSVSVVTVDQVKNILNGTVLARAVSSGTNLGIDQSQQPVNKQCTVLFYNVFSSQAEASIELYPTGPCTNIGISRKVLNFTFLPCDCPNGFQKAPLSSECNCICDYFLEQYIRDCELDRERMIVTVIRQSSDIWIQYEFDNLSNVTGFLYTQCPHDYCIKQPVNISLSLPKSVDEQCALNRSGILCGKCKRGSSLVFGSSNCIECSDRGLALLIAFALAGIMLVIFILVLNVTVATGTIHGLVLYANIIGASRSTFLTTETNMGFFVSWINLDLGIETCFYNGMDSYAKVLLQLVFPTYVITLSALIIILSEYWGRFAGLIGRKNPIATLCTLIFLSYSKLLRATIFMLQFTTLEYPDGSTQTVWWYDANINYFKASHIPRFVFSTIIIALGVIYTLMLFFGQWFRKYSQTRFLRWARNSRYNAFVDAYHAPFNVKHRYWMGVLLLTRIIHHFLAAVLADSAHLIIVTSLIIGILSLKILITRLYKKWILDTLESLYLVNLLCFAVATYYVKDANKINGQVIVANISVYVVFITFVATIACHTHAYCLTGLKTYRALVQSLKDISCAISKQMRNLTRNCLHARSQPRELSLTTAHQLQQQSTVPVGCVVQLREPALDLIAPLLSPEELPKPQTVVPQPVTSTVVDISKMEDSV